MTKPVKRVDLSKLSVEQRAAFIQFANDCRDAAPEMLAMRRTAETLYQQMIRSKKWTIVDAPIPDARTTRHEQWSIGAPKVNYVDHIEGI